MFPQKIGRWDVQFEGIFTSGGPGEKEKAPEVKGAVRSDRWHKGGSLGRQETQACRPESLN